MGRVLFDLAGADPDLRFSPFCWRTKMALKHKGLDFEARPWRFIEKERLTASGQGRVPTLVDNDTWVHDSWSIAEFLDRAYPESRPIFESERDKTAAAFQTKWAEFSLHLPIFRVCILDIHAVPDEANKKYFRESREERFGMTLEELASEPGKARAQLLSALQPMEQTLKAVPYLGGREPNYGDYAVFGSLMWPNAVMREPLLDQASSVGQWFERMLDLFDGYARGAKTARS